MLPCGHSFVCYIWQQRSSKLNHHKVETLQKSSKNCEKRKNVHLQFHKMNFFIVFGYFFFIIISLWFLIALIKSHNCSAFNCPSWRGLQETGSEESL